MVLNLTGKLDRFCDDVATAMARQNVTLPDALEEIRSYVGSDLADYFEEWWNEGEDGG